MKRRTVFGATIAVAMLGLVSGLSAQQPPIRIGIGQANPWIVQSYDEVPRTSGN